MEWQPIETAPEIHDMLVTDGKIVCQGGWVSPEDQGAEPEEYFRCPGYRWNIECINPTHWMPLPEPPK